MSDLVRWLRAQLDDDERLANEAGNFCWHDCDADSHEHHERWDPARVLREVEAKRRIIDMYDTAAGEGFVGQLYRNSAEPTLRLLALPYADRPDYDEAWRP